MVALVAGGGGLGGPDRVQQGEVVGVGQGLVSCLGGGVLLAVAVQHAGQDGEGLLCSWWRAGRRVRWCGGRSGPVRGPGAGREPGQRVWATR